MADLAIALLVLALLAFVFGMGVMAGVALGYEKRDREVIERELAVLDECLEAWGKESRDGRQ